MDSYSQPEWNSEDVSSTEDQMDWFYKHKAKSSPARSSVPPPPIPDPQSRAVASVPPASMTASPTFDPSYDPTQDSISAAVSRLPGALPREVTHSRTHLDDGTSLGWTRGATNVANVSISNTHNNNSYYSQQYFDDSGAAQSGGRRDTKEPRPVRLSHYHNSITAMCILILIVFGVYCWLDSVWSKRVSNAVQAISSVSRCVAWIQCWAWGSNCLPLDTQSPPSAAAAATPTPSDALQLSQQPNVQLVLLGDIIASAGRELITAYPTLYSSIRTLDVDFSASVVHYEGELESQLSRVLGDHDRWLESYITFISGIRPCCGPGATLERFARMLGLRPGPAADVIRWGEYLADGLLNETMAAEKLAELLDSEEQGQVYRPVRDTFCQLRDSLKVFTKELGPPPLPVSAIAGAPDGEMGDETTVMAVAQMSDAKKRERALAETHRDTAYHFCMASKLAMSSGATLRREIVHPHLAALASATKAVHEILGRARGDENMDHAAAKVALGQLEKVGREAKKKLAELYCW